MVAFEDVFKNRKDEIESFIKLLRFLEMKELDRGDDGVSAFNKFFDLKNNGIKLSYQELINIYKSNLTLMLYNIIEYTVNSLIVCIYDEIKSEELSYIDVNDSIKQLWKKAMLKSTTDPNANYQTFVKKMMS